MAELRDAGVPQLTDLSLRGVITWVLQVLNITMEAVWAKLAAHPRIGPERVARIRGMISHLEGIWTFVKDVQERGVSAIWERLQEQLSNLWTTIVDSVKNWIMERVVNRVMARLLSMLDPTGIMAVINSVVAMYRAVQSFVRYIREMLQVVNSFAGGVADVAGGNIRTAASYLEGAMSRAMPIMIGFLANQVGLSGIGRQVSELIGAGRELVDRAMVWLVDRAVNMGGSLLEMGRSAVGAVAGWLGIEERVTAENGEAHRLFIGGSEEEPELMLASNPTSFRAFINDINPGTDEAMANAKRDALPIAASLDREMRALRRRNPETRQANQHVVTHYMHQLAPHVRILLRNLSLPDGTTNKPIPITWYKPHERYPQRIALETRDGSMQGFAFGSVHEYEIPDMDALIGTDGGPAARRFVTGGMVEFGTPVVPDVGMKMEKARSVRLGDAQAAFRAICNNFGYNLRERNMDADHIVDLQFSGFDDLTNMWPLNSDINRSSMLFLNQLVTFSENGVGRALPLHDNSLRGKTFIIRDARVFT